MSKNSIDKLFRDRLSKYEEPYPQHLWEGVYNGITGNVSRKRRGVLWYRWMLLGVILLMATGAGWYIWQTGQDTGDVHNEMQDNQVFSMDSGQASVDDAQNTTGERDHEDSVMDDEAAVSDQNINSVSDHSHATAGGSDKDLDVAHANNGTGITSDKKKEGLSTLLNDLTSKSIATTEGSLITDEGALSTESTNLSGNADQGFTETAGGEMSEGSLLASRSDAMAIKGLEGYKNYRISEDISEDQNRLMRDALPELNSYRKRRFVGHWGVAVVYGQDVVNRTLDIRSEGDLALLNQRSESESFVNAFVTGFEVNMKVRKWSVYSGLHYSQINERVNYILTGTERTVNGNPVVGDLRRSVVNRYQMLSIPLYLGYEVTRGPWALEAQAGVNLGISMNSSGEVFDRESLSYMAYDNNSDNNPYKANPGMSWHGALMLSYKTGYGQRIFIRPNIRWYGSSFTQDEYGLEQKYQSYGVMAGYRVNL